MTHYLMRLLLLLIIIGALHLTRAVDETTLLDDLPIEVDEAETIPIIDVDNLPASTIPIIDVSPLFWKSFPLFFHFETVQQIGRACQDVGFFIITGMPYDTANLEFLMEEAKSFFAQPLEKKREIDMSKGGRAWRGYFSVGDELTSGRPDQKEGIYFGVDLRKNETHLQGKPLHGKNLYPVSLYVDSKTKKSKKHYTFKRTVTYHMSLLKEIALALMQAIALSLDLPHSAFEEAFANPTELFRIFSYPPHDAQRYPDSQGVGEHTDYGFLTLLHQDDSGGLQVRDAATNEWIDVPYIPGSYVVNLGDALEHYTGGLYRATPHRVRQRVGATKPRISMPYFFDPHFDADLTSVVDELPVTLKEVIAARREKEIELGQSYSRWDNADPSLFRGKYGTYLQAKVSKVFPQLFADTMAGSAAGSGDAAASASDADGIRQEL